ncbi:MAG TPA: TolC family protein, partial [Bryobacteraceae bacterium]|nr:TolC family protein [Bryobacteraceae bacterium]
GVALDLHAQAAAGAMAPIAAQLPLSGRTGQAGAVVTAQNPVPSGSSVNTLSSSVQVEGDYQGSVPSSEVAGPPLQLSLANAIRRGLESNLGDIGYRNSIRQARAQRQQAFSALLPTLNGYAQATEEQINLASFGFHFSFPGFSIPAVVGPFHYVDARATLTQNVLNITALRNYRASREALAATQYAAEDARDLVVLAVTGGYLQVIAAAARMDSARAQVAAARAVYQQAMDRHDAGLAARIDVTRSQVELQVQQQRLTSEETNYAKLKIQLGRIIGLPPGQEFTLTDTVPYAPLTDLTIEQALTRAYANRADLKAAQAQVQAAETAKRAAQAERYPYVDLYSDYGATGTALQNSHGAFTVTGSVRFNIFDGGRISADVEAADAALAQRRAELADLRGQIDAEVRQAFLDLTTAEEQVTVSQSNRQLAQDTLAQSRDRFAAGVADTVEVVQAQEQVAAAEQDYIASLYAHNLAKASLARALGQADQNMQQFLGR